MPDFIEGHIDLGHATLADVLAAMRKYRSVGFSLVPEARAIARQWLGNGINWDVRPDRLKVASPELPESNHRPQPTL